MTPEEKNHIVRNKVLCIGGCLLAIEKCLVENKTIHPYLMDILKCILEINQCDESAV